MTDKEKLIQFLPGFDKRHPDPTKNYGIKGMEIKFVLKGEKGATQFVIYTDWYPTEVQKEYFYKGLDRKYFSVRPMGADIGYHSPIPMFEDQKPIIESCEYIDGKPCYYDGSGLAAEKLVPLFLEMGVDVVWNKLEEDYEYYFGGGNG